MSNKKADGKTPLIHDLRFRSVRGYRRLADETLHRMRRGDISAASGKAIIEGARAAAEMMMAENVLKANEVADKEAAMPEGVGADGGFDFKGEERGRGHVTRRRTHKIKTVTPGIGEEEVTTVTEGGAAEADGDFGDIPEGPSDTTP